MRNGILKPVWSLAICTALMIAEQWGVHSVKVLAWTLHGFFLVYVSIIFFIARRRWRRQDAELQQLLRQFRVLENEMRNPKPEQYHRAPWN